MDRQTGTHPILQAWLERIICIALAAGIILSILSWMHICAEICAAGHRYRLYGIAFEPIGISFFIITLLLYAFGFLFAPLYLIAGGLISAAVGAEVMFLYAQKAIIGHWCPICLNIAASVFIAFAALVAMWLFQTAHYIKHRERRKIMYSMIRGLGAAACIAFGFLFAFSGFAKFSHLHAHEADLKDNLAFGNKNGPIEIYVFSDWECASCHKIEPVIAGMMPEISKDGRVIFVDYIVHEESLNFTPYNLSFMINNKDKYLKLRNMLTEMSMEVEPPTDQQVEEGAKALGVNYKKINFADVSSAIKYFKHLGKQFDVEGTPTLVIVNSKMKKGKKLEGASEITQENIRKAIKDLQ